MKFSRLVEYKSETFLFKDHAQSVVRKLFSKSFLKSKD